MEYSGGHDFMLCGLCGTLLTMKSYEYAECGLCGFKRDAREIVGREIRYTVTAEDIRRELNTQPFVKLDGSISDDVQLKRTVIDMPCQKCKHPQLEYYTAQARGADEGQTVYYQCPKCGAKQNENT